MIAVLIILGVVLLFWFTAFTGAPYVPSKKSDLRAAFTRLYHLGASDMLVDLGSGDGVVLRTARRYGARAVGYEIGPVYVWVSRLLAMGDKKQQVIAKNYWHCQFPADTTVVYAFSTSRDITRLHKLVQRQATHLQRPLWLLTYGISVPGVAAAAEHQAHYLYRVAPCANGKA